MQKLINVLAVTSFLVSASVVASGAYVYMNRDSLQETAVDRITDTITEMLPSMLGGVGLGGEDSPLPSVGTTDLPIDLPF